MTATYICQFCGYKLIIEEQKDASSVFCLVCPEVHVMKLEAK